MVDDAGIVWQTPPESKPRRCDVVAAALLGRPGEWAKIDTGPMTLTPWWGPLCSDRVRFEVRLVRHSGQGPFGVRDVYARARADRACG